MKPGKNLRDRLASQSGAPRSGAGPLSDGGMSKLIEAERAKHREAAEGGGDAIPKKKPAGNPPAPQTAPRTNKAAGAKGANKSTTNQGLR